MYPFWSNNACGLEYSHSEPGNNLVLLWHNFASLQEYSKVIETDILMLFYWHCVPLKLQQVHPMAMPTFCAPLSTLVWVCVWLPCPLVVLGVGPILFSQLETVFVLIPYMTKFAHFGGGKGEEKKKKKKLFLFCLNSDLLLNLLNTLDTYLFI